MIILETLYLVSAALLALYGLNSLTLTWLSRRAGPEALARRSKGSGPDGRSPGGPPAPDAGSPAVWPLPLVTVQLPIYNERHVIKRLIEAALALEWPADRLQIQILDDSTDDTRTIISDLLAGYRTQGVKVDIQHLPRARREHFKAGALQHGLASAAGEFIAIFDADFLPPPDFLRKTIPLFDDERVGCIQTRWGHLNAEASRLTQAQALGIDGHFVVEQAARCRVKAFLNFNGTAGVWRRRCMTDAGGWQGDTLTEDLDLSYRAQMRGWRILYRGDIIAPAELPIQIDAFKRQQFRWAKGSIQTALKLLGPFWRIPQPVWLKLLGTLHLTNYAVHPLMLLNLLLTLPMTLSDSPFLLLTPVFALSAVGPPLLYWTTMRPHGLPWPVRLNRLISLIILGTGLSLTNTKAVFEALFDIRSDFKRTPKFAVTGHSRQWQTSPYALPRHPMAWLELLLAGYAIGLLGWTIALGVWQLIPWLALYAGGYSYISGLAFIQARQTRAARLGLAG